jgi:hypothetical protein
MTHQLKCPACSKPLYFPKFGDCCEELVEGICNCCQYKYALMEAEVTSFVSQVETRNNTHHNKQASYNRTYQFRLKQVNGATKAVQFTTAGQVEKISALPGDLFLLLYTMRGKALEELVRVENVSTRKSLLLLNPNVKALSRSFGAGVATLFVSFVVAGVLNISTNHLFLATTVPGAIGIGVYVSKRSSLKVRSSLELLRLSSEQQLLAQKHDLEQKVAQLTQELKANSSLVNRLQALRHKMISADADLYARRIITVTSGIDVIEEQNGLVQNLVNGYSQLLKVIEIEYETSRLAEKLPSDFTSQVLTRLDELKLIEAQKEELALRVDPQKLLSEV